MSARPRHAPAFVAPQPRRWWHDAVGYEVYLRSFADSDGDGVGDLPGLLARLDHLAWLGIDVVWITPCYPSPMHDHGYDVADYRGVDPRFGTMADLDALIARCHALGMRFVMDLVPNHTSSEHPWFQAARSSRDNPYRDYYLWRDPAPDGGPPNNWRSHFGGPAWTYDEGTGQYWCHLFLPEQPDLNWRNPAVRAEFDDILRFWFERGVDGFRIDVAHALLKHPDLPDLPPAELDAVEGPGNLPEFEALSHVYDLDQQPDVFEVYRRWRRIADEHDALLLGEVYVLDGGRYGPYVADQDGLHLAFWFPPLHIEWEPETLRGALIAGLSAARGHAAWVQGSHDRPRAVTRYGGGRLGQERALAFATLQLGLPGMPVLYQGEELGLADGEVPEDQAADPIGVRARAFTASRDGCRTPIPWAPGPGWGFTTGQPWLPFGARTPEDTVAVQRDDEASMLHRFRALVRLRHELDDLRRAELVWLTDAGPVLAYRRGAALVAANCGDAPASLTLPEGGWQVAFRTDGRCDGQVLAGACTLPARAAMVAVTA